MHPELPLWHIWPRYLTTEVYSRIGRTWKIIHSYWWYMEPELEQPGS
jgi:hypothetical protein